MPGWKVTQPDVASLPKEGETEPGPADSRTLTLFKSELDKGECLLLLASRDVARLVLFCERTLDQRGPRLPECPLDPFRGTRLGGDRSRSQRIEQATQRQDYKRLGIALS